jgi:hypothetical protein
MTHPTTVMNPLDPLSLLERARQELQARKLDRADFALELLQCHMQQRQIQTPAPAAPTPPPKPKPQSVQPVLDLHKKREPNPLYEVVCEYLRTRVIGYAFTHKDLKEHFLASANIQLDKTIDGTGYERYRSQLSKVFETLKDHEVLQKGSKKTEHVLVKYP